MPSLTHAFLDRWLVAAFAGENPSDAEWEDYVRTLREGDYDGCLAVSDGGGPNAAQRARLSSLSPELRARPTAVVSSSPVVRGIVTALSWHGRNARPFKPEELEQAFVYLGVTGVMRVHLRAAIIELRAELSCGGVDLTERPRSRPLLS